MLTERQTLERAMLRLNSQEENYFVSRVEDTPTSWYVAAEDGSGFAVAKKHGVEPHVHDCVTLYYVNGKWTGIRGMDVNRKPVYFQTDAELAVEHEQYVQEQERKQKASFEENRAQLDEDYNGLPAVFKKRIDRFREGNPDFRWKYESYEMFCCTQAVVIAIALGTTEELTKWAELPYEEQKRLVPLLGSGHSGNTFGMACYLARVYLVNSEAVVLQHGSLTPLVGCEEYGCSHDE